MCATLIGIFNQSDAELKSTADYRLSAMVNSTVNSNKTNEVVWHQNDLAKVLCGNPKGAACVGWMVSTTHCNSGTEISREWVDR